MALLPPFSSLAAYTSTPVSTVSGSTAPSSSSAISSSAAVPSMSQHASLVMSTLPHRYQHDRSSPQTYHERRQQLQHHYHHHRSSSSSSSSSSFSPLPSPPSSVSSSSRLYPSPSDTLVGHNNSKLTFTHSNASTKNPSVDSIRSSLSSSNSTKMDSYHSVDPYASHQPAAVSGQHYDERHHHHQHPSSSTSYPHGFPSPAFSSSSPPSSSSSSSSAQAQASSSAPSMVQTSATSSSALSLPTPQYVPQDMTLSLESINIRLLSEALQREGFADLGNWMALTQQQHEVMALTMQQQQQQQQQQQPEQSLLPPSPALTTTTNDNASTAYPTQQQQQQQQPANPVYQGLQEYANVAPFVQTADDLQFNLLVFGDNTVSPFPGTLFNNDQSSIETHGFLHAAGKDEMGLGALDPLASFNSHQLPFTTTYGSGQNINSQLSSAQALVSDGGPGSSSSAHPPAMPFLNGTGLGDLFQFDPKLAEWMRSTQTSYFPEAPEPYDSDDEHGEVDGGLADYDQDAVPGLISDDAPAVSQSPATNKRSYDDYAAQQQGHPFNYAQQDPFSGARKHAKMSKTEQKRRHSHSRNNSVATVSDMMYENAYYQQQHQQQQQQQQQPSSSPLHPRSSHPSDDESQGSSSSSSSAHLPKTIEKRVHHCTVPGCDKAFTRAFNLRSHLNTHNGERPHKCPHADCNWDFVRRHDLDRHIKSKHMPDKPYACTKCTSRFGRSDALQRHRRLEGH